MVMGTITMAASTVTAVGDAIWSEDFAQRWETFYCSFVATGDKWLDHAAAVDLTSKTTTNDAMITWTDEWSQFTSFGAWSEWDFYKEVMLDAMVDSWQGIKSVSCWLLLTFQPIMYSGGYLLGRMLQVTLGAFLPYLQRAFIEVCRFHLHFGWKQAVGEVSFFLFLYYTWVITSFLRRQQYIGRTKSFIRGKKLNAKRAIQNTYKEIAHVSLLLAMGIPHACYIGLVVIVKTCYPAWVTKVSAETSAPSLLKFWYPIIATIAVLHQARIFYSESKTPESGNGNGKRTGTLSSAKSKSASQEIEEEKAAAAKKKGRRRKRSSIGALLHGATPGDAGADNEGYTEEELNEDVKYWLNYWLLYSSSKAAYSLSSKVMLVSTLVMNPTVHCILCQGEFFFYIWIFCLPECLLVLFPSAGEEERRDWSKQKQWCYECALNPVMAIPSLFLPIIVPCFEKVSQAVSHEDWKNHVVDYVKQPLGLLVMLKMLSEPTKDAILDNLSNFNTLVIPALTLFTPSCITQYGVWYVQYIVPQAHSLTCRRNTQRILYLKFWVLHAFASVLISWGHTVFWIVPLKTHLTFVAWCVLVMPRLITAIYNELDRELQAFHLLPPVADGLSVENTHTARALSILYATLPKAEDVDINLQEKQIDLTDADEKTNGGEKIDAEAADDGKRNTVDDRRSQFAASDAADATRAEDDAGGKEDKQVGNMEFKKDEAVNNEEVDKVGDPKPIINKSVEKEGEKENHSSIAKNKPLAKIGTAKVDEDGMLSPSKSKPVKDATAKKKSETSESLRRRSNRLKQSAN